MLNREKLVNAVVFLERASKTLNGAQETRAFAQTYEAVMREIEKIDVRIAKKGVKK